MTEYFAEKARDFDLMETRMVNWNLAPLKFSLPKDLKEKSNLVDDMEQDVGATKNATDKVQFEIQKRQKDLSAAADRATALREQFKDFEKMSNDLNSKLQQAPDIPFMIIYYLRLVRTHYNFPIYADNDGDSSCMMCESW